MKNWRYGRNRYFRETIKPPLGMLRVRMADRRGVEAIEDRGIPSEAVSGGNLEEILLGELARRATYRRNDPSSKSMASGDGETSARVECLFLSRGENPGCVDESCPPVSSSRENTRGSKFQPNRDTASRSLIFPPRPPAVIRKAMFQDTEPSPPPALASVKIFNRGRIRSILKYAGWNGDNGAEQRLSFVPNFGIRGTTCVKFAAMIVRRVHVSRKFARIF